MDISTQGRLALSSDYPGVTFGQGVVLYGQVTIGPSTRIGDYCIVGAPTVEHIADRKPLYTTKIGSNVIMAPHCVIYNDVVIENNVRIHEKCRVGWESRIGKGTQLLYGAQIYCNVKIGKNCIIAGFCCDDSIIENNVKCFGKLIHRLDTSQKCWDSSIGEPSPKIKHGAIIGFDTLIIGGVVVGSNTFIPVKRKITHDVPNGKNLSKLTNASAEN